MSMKQVRAIERGFFDGIREVGDVFHIPDDFDMPWVVAIEEPQPEKSEKPEKKGKKEDDSKPA